MAEQMQTGFKSTVVGACIIATSILAAAFIVSPKAEPATSTAPSRIIPTSVLAGVPIPIDSIKQQFIAQILKHAAGKEYSVNKVKRTLSDVQIEDVRYSHKRDKVLVSYRLIWKPNAITTEDDKPMDCTLQDDDYGRFVSWIDLNLDFINDMEHEDRPTIIIK